MAIQIPINFVTKPGAFLSAACFANQQYREDDTTSCISNLLSVGYRLFVIDIYWDADRKTWSLCPVAIPDSPASSTPGTSTASSPSSSVSSPSSSALVTNTLTAAASSSPSASGMRARQDGTQSPSMNPTSSMTISAVNGSSTPTAIYSMTSLPAPLREPYYQIGPYSCSPGTNLSLIINTLNNFIKSSEDTLSAHLLNIVLNIHAAASVSSPNDPAEQPLSLPEGDDLLGTIFETPFSSYLYTPTELRQDRADLNSSWYSVLERYQPDGAYYSTTSDSNGNRASVDGWPSEGYVEFIKGKRLLVGWGTIDPQMQEYNSSADVGTIFPPGYIEDTRNVSASAAGQITNGCFFDAGITNLASVNSSWAVSGQVMGFNVATSPGQPLGPTLELTSSLTNCGISPLLNRTLLNSTASQDPSAYMNVSFNTIWSWAPGEPQNFTTQAGDGASSTDQSFRCALMTNALNGHWRVENCDSTCYAACRAQSDPYSWLLSPSATSYSASVNVCPSNSTFTVPRTALENAYLFAALHARSDASSVWLNFNSLDVEGCWVAGGPNATCPYYVSASGVRRKNVIIPTVAAIIVLVLTGLTLFVKCNANRRVRRRRRMRAEATGDYEGCVSSVWLRGWMLMLLTAGYLPDHWPSRL